MTITVQYSCTLCGVLNASVDVPARMTDEEDVVHWVKEVCGNAVGADHQRRSPGCPATHMRDLKIPIDGAERVGGPVVQ